MTLRPREGTDEDVRLVKKLAAGSVNAWHLFLEKHSGLIYNVVKRHMFDGDDDEIRSLYVDVLKRLYDGELAKYDGRAKLSTWLIVFTRARTFDHVRRVKGRKRLPKASSSLSDVDRIVLQHYYVDKLGLDAVIAQLVCRGFDVTVDDVVNSILRIERLDRRYLRRIELEKWTLRGGVSSVRMLRALLEVRSQYQARAESYAADIRVTEAEANRVAERVRKAVRELPEAERRIIALRFEKQATAGEISADMGLGGARRAYTMIDRVLRKLRRAVGVPEHERRVTSSSVSETVRANESTGEV